MSKKEFRELIKIAVEKLPGPKNKYWSLADEFGNTITKAELLERGGNGFVMSKSNPNLMIPIKDGFIDLDNFAQATVNVKGGFSADRNVNFKYFNKELAEYWSLNPDKIPHSMQHGLKIKALM